jgi:hypothetical protein
MPIHVICPGCHARFQVSDKFAGKKGPCPKCKKVIRVPDASEQVVVHEPEHSEAGARDAQGRYVLKPLARTKVRLHPLATVAIVGSTLSIVVIALAARTVQDTGLRLIILSAGAIVLAPPLALAGYSFLRNTELEPYRGRALAGRTAICSAVYAASWGAYWLLYPIFWGDAPVEALNVVPFAVGFLLLGAGTAYVCYDLDFGSGFFHYALYLLVTILMRMAMGLAPV